MGLRRRARELALTCLYRADILNDWDNQITPEEHGEEFREKRNVIDFAKRIFEGTVKNKTKIDILIDKFADNWSINRMNLIDRNILRIATYEILFCEDIPKTVSINEAIELAKIYSDKDSPAFINGILDRIASERLLF